MPRALFILLSLLAFLMWVPSKGVTVHAVHAADVSCKEASSSDEEGIVHSIDDAIKGYNAKDQNEIDEYVTDTVHVLRSDGDGMKTETHSKAEYAKHNEHDWKMFKNHKAFNRCIKSLQTDGKSAQVSLTYDFAWNSCSMDSKQSMEGKLELQKSQNKDGKAVWLISDMNVKPVGDTTGKCPGAASNQMRQMPSMTK